MQPCAFGSGFGNIELIKANPDVHVGKSPWFMYKYDA